MEAMPGPQAVPIIFTTRQKEIITCLDQKVRCPLDLSLRVKIILLAASGKTNAAIVHELERESLTKPSDCMCRETEFNFNQVER